jgi:hypothetical protein
MDLSMTEDVIFLAMTFLIAIGLTAAMLVWDRASASRQPR